MGKLGLKYFVSNYISFISFLLGCIIAFSSLTAFSPKDYSSYKISSIKKVNKTNKSFSHTPRPTWTQIGPFYVFFDNSGEYLVVIHNSHRNGGRFKYIIYDSNGDVVEEDVTNTNTGLLPIPPPGGCIILVGEKDAYIIAF